MKKRLIVILITVIIIILWTGLDLIIINTRGRPLFTIASNNNKLDTVYKGILYNTYNCASYAKPVIKFRWTDYTCPINNDDITDIKLTIEETAKKEIIPVLEMESYTIYYYGIKKATIEVENIEYDFAEALSTGQITLTGLFDKLTSVGTYWDGGSVIYRDGGSSISKASTFTLIRCHTIDGNRDIYLGNEEMEFKETFCK